MCVCGKWKFFFILAKINWMNDNNNKKVAILIHIIIINYWKKTNWRIFFRQYLLLLLLQYFCFLFFILLLFRFELQNLHLSFILIHIQEVKCIYIFTFEKIRIIILIMYVLFASILHVSPEKLTLQIHTSDKLFQIITIYNSVKIITESYIVWLDAKRKKKKKMEIEPTEKTKQSNQIKHLNKTKQ